MNLDIKNPLFAIYSYPLSRAKHLCSPFAGTDHACCGRSGKFESPRQASLRRAINRHPERRPALLLSRPSCSSGAGREWGAPSNLLFVTSRKNQIANQLLLLPLLPHLLKNLLRPRRRLRPLTQIQFHPQRQFPPIHPQNPSPHVKILRCISRIG